MDWGEKLQWLLEMAEETGNEPKALQSRTVVADHLQFPWLAFWDLHTDRAMGMGAGPIPFTSIDRYARRYGVGDIDQFDAFRDLIRAMDGTYLDWLAQRQPSGSET